LWKTIGSITANVTSPANPVIGNAWWNPTNKTFNVWDGNAWTFVGPAFSNNTGAVTTTITDAGNIQHDAVMITVGGANVCVVSKDSSYSPSPSIDGFTSVGPGLNLSSLVANAKIWGTATQADALVFNGNSVPASNFARTDVATTFNSTVSIGTPSGLTIGSANNFTTGVSGNVVQLTNNVTGANIAIRSNIAGSLINTVLVNGANGAVTMTGLVSAPNFVTAGAVTATGNAVVGGVTTAGGITAGILGVTGNVTTAGNVVVTRDVIASGNVTAQFFNGTSIQAQYADLAERFHADAEYSPGTVLSMGGMAEVTLADEELSESVFGVVSTRAAYLMNSGAGTDKTHPAIAVSGRVPVRVIGKVNKGDRLVSAGNGLARVGLKNEITPFNVIGRALANKTDDQEGVVYAIVKLNS
jgi:hypothetical protein